MSQPPVHLVFGATGQVGYDLVRELAPLGRVVGLSRPDVDLERLETVRDAIRLHRPAIIWNAAAATSVDALEDLITEWKLRRQDAVDALRLKGDPIPADMVPPLEFSVIDASFDAVRDPAEREYLLNLPTTLSLSPAAVDRLRAAAAEVLRDSVPFRKLVDEISAEKNASDAAGRRWPSACCPRTRCRVTVPC